jgi:hypothetical protein
MSDVVRIWTSYGPIFLEEKKFAKERSFILCVEEIGPIQRWSY